ncbi:Kinesin-like protein KIN-13B, partial [Bienertia sinuspersici]
IPAHNLYDGSSLNQHVRGKSLEESDTYLANKNTNRANSVAKIKVVVRKRPLNKREMSKNEDDIITIDPSSSALTVHETKLKVDLTEYVERHGFVFDAVLHENVSNDMLYLETVEPVVPLIFQKTKATCFAYGQTGKEWKDLYYAATTPESFPRHVEINSHFFEIYGGKLFDLLCDRKSLCMREDGKKQVCIVGLQEYKVSDAETIRDLIERGNATRSTGITGANEESSRSHAILQLVIKRSADGSESKPPRPVGKLSFIDLAGSERGADTTDNDKQTRMEGAEINKSLLALKECIRALDNDQNHIPFRGSKLTEVLRDSFVGNSKTIMISCVSPNSGSCEHTLNTLRYADRVKSLSKGNNSKRDLASSTVTKDTLSQSLNSGGLAQSSNLEDMTTDGLNGSGRFGWPREHEREVSLSPKVERVHSGRADNTFVSGYSDYFRGQKGGLGDMSVDDYVPATTENRMRKDANDFSSNNMSSDDDLNVLLKEEEDLVASHRGLIDETIKLVTEEMNLLIEAEQPGNQLDDYVSKLNSILSQKAAGILKLQSQLANFKRRLNDHNVLVSAGRY